MIYGDIIRDYWQKVCYRELPQSKAKLWLVQHCMAISATTERLRQVLYDCGNYYWKSFCKPTSSLEKTTAQYWNATYKMAAYPVTSTIMLTDW